MEVESRKKGNEIKETRPFYKQRAFVTFIERKRLSGSTAGYDPYKRIIKKNRIFFI